MPNNARTRFWHNPLFYRAALGLLAALIAWGLGEIPFRWSRTSLDAFTVYSAEAEKISKAVHDGGLTSPQGVEAMNTLNHASSGNPYVKIVNNRDYSPKEKRYRVERLRSQDERKSRLGPPAWFSIVGVILAVFLSAADPLAAGKTRSTVIHAGLGALLGLLGGIVVCLLAGDLHRAIPDPLADTTDLVRQTLGRAATWAILGLFLAMPPGLLLWNSKRLMIGLTAGLLAGLLGGALIDPLCFVTGSGIVSRLVALAVVGVGIGLATSLIEDAVKPAWLRIVAGPLAGRQFVLYCSPTRIGSSPRGDIYLFGDTGIAPLHAAIRIADGHYDLEDLHTGAGTLVNGQPVNSARLASGDQIQVGSTCFLFEQKPRTAP